MSDNPLEAVIKRIEAATVKTEMLHGPTEASGVINDEDVRPAIVEAIAIKSLDPHYDTTLLFTDIAKEVESTGEATGRKIAPSEFDKIIGQVVKDFKEEQLLGPQTDTGRGR